MPIGKFLYRFMKQKNRHFTNSGPAHFPTITDYSFLYSVHPPSSISPLPPETHKNRKTVYASSRKRMETEEVLVLKK